jgi:hypothetical protein
VWGVWLVLLLLVLVCFVKYTRNIPFSEDWLLVPAMTGHEPHLLSWTWAQHNEHRTPLPRVILLAALKVTGDFRAGMLLSICVLAALSAAFIYTAARLRGRTSVLDVIFPIGLLHLGNWENLFWGWQFTQVLPTALLCAILLALMLDPTLSTPRIAVPTAICLVLLPLSGANGLIAAPFLACLVGYYGVKLWRKGDPWRRIASLLLGSAAATVGFTGLYFVGYQARSYGLPSPDLPAAVYAALQFAALSFGPASRSSWALSVLVTTVLFLATAVMAVYAVVRHTGPQRQRAIALLAMFGTMSLFAAGVGWGRAEVLLLPEWGGIWPARYSLLALPLLFIAFFVWDLHGRGALRTSVLWGLVVVMIFLLPYNMVHGLWWRDWYLQGVDPFARDLGAGLSSYVVGERNREFLFRWMHPSFDKLRMLQQARIGGFAALTDGSTVPDDAPRARQGTDEAESTAGGLSDVPRVNFTIRYVMPEADEVSLVWGLNGWHLVAETLRPSGTEVRNHLMHTPMIRSAGAFAATVAIPSGATVNYCFQITKAKEALDVIWPSCDGDYKNAPVKDDVAEVRTTLTFALLDQAFRYVMPDAEEVYLVWGLNGWHPVPESLFPEGTVVKYKVMETPMRRNGEAFLATVRIPAGTTLDYGFRITKRGGLFDLVYPVFDGNYRSNPSSDGVIETQGKAKLLPDLSQIIREARLLRNGG